MEAILLATLMLTSSPCCAGPACPITLTVPMEAAVVEHAATRPAVAKRAATKARAVLSDLADRIRALIERLRPDREMRAQPVRNLARLICHPLQRRGR
jgi:hypothetical protein